MTEHIVTVQKVVEKEEPAPHNANVTVMRMTFCGKVSMYFEQGDKADRIAAAERAHRRGVMVVFGD